MNAETQTNIPGDDPICNIFNNLDKLKIVLDKDEALVRMLSDMINSQNPVVTSSYVRKPN